MKNFFNRMLYGKSNKKDLTKEDIEGKSRIQLFFEILGVKYGQLIKLNLILIVFLIPAIALTLIFFNLLLYGELSAEELSSYRIMYFTILIPCLLIAAPAISGATYVIRNFTQDRHSFVLSDFIERTKENLKQSLLYMLIFSAFLLLGQIVLRLYDITQVINGDSLILVFAKALFIGVYIFVILSSMYVYPMIVTYDMKLKDIIRNSIYLTIGKLPATIGIAILAILPIILLLLLSLTYQIFFIVFIFYILFIAFTLAMYITITYTTNTFDKYMKPIDEDEDEDESNTEE